MEKNRVDGVQNGPESHAHRELRVRGRPSPTRERERTRPLALVSTARSVSVPVASEVSNGDFSLLKSSNFVKSQKSHDTSCTMFVSFPYLTNVNGVSLI